MELIIITMSCSSVELTPTCVFSRVTSRITLCVAVDYCNERVCLSICEQISETKCQKFKNSTKFSTYVAYGRGLATSHYVVHTSGFRG